MDAYSLYSQLGKYIHGAIQEEFAGQLPDDMMISLDNHTPLPWNRAYKSIGLRPKISRLEDGVIKTFVSFNYWLKMASIDLEGGTDISIVSAPSNRYREYKGVTEERLDEVVRDAAFEFVSRYPSIFEHYSSISVNGEKLRFTVDI